MALRAHHICCIRYWGIENKARGDSFNRVLDKIKSVLHTQSDVPVTVIEGTDELCQECPLCMDNYCVSPRGSEEAVRKWDAILLSELGLPPGTCLTSGEWQALLKEKTPFRICRKCQWQTICAVSGENR